MKSVIDLWMPNAAATQYQMLRDWSDVSTQLDRVIGGCGTSCPQLFSKWGDTYTPFHSELCGSAAMNYCPSYTSSMLMWFGIHILTTIDRLTKYYEVEQTKSQPESIVSSSFWDEFCSTMEMTFHYYNCDDEISPPRHARKSINGVPLTATVAEPDDEYTQRQRNNAVHTTNIFTWLSRCDEIKSLFTLFTLAQVPVYYLTQRPMDVVISQPSPEFAHLVVTVGDFTENIAWNSHFSGETVTTSMRLGGYNLRYNPTTRSNSAAAAQFTLADVLCDLNDKLKKQLLARVPEIEKKMDRRRQARRADEQVINKNNKKSV